MSSTAKTIAKTQTIDQSNPALKPLGVLVGMWKTEIVFPADPSNKIRGHASFEWLESGAFLIMRLPIESDAPLKSIWLMSRDDSVDTYTVPYFDTRGVSRVYQMSLERDEWKLWREAPGFSQRFKGTFSADKRIITARWEKLSDGSNWEHDFDMTFIKVTE